MSVTVTDTISAALPCTANGIVSVNWLPYWLAAADEYHVVKADDNGTVSVLVAMVAFDDGANWNVPLVMSRVDENPETTTVIPPGVWENETVETNGTVGLVVMVALGGGFGVTFVPPVVRLETVSVIVPATVPVKTVTLDLPENWAAVVPAGMVNGADVPPVPN